MAICNLEKENNVIYFASIVDIVLMFEYLILLVFLVIFWKRSYNNTLYNLVEYRNYLLLIIISSILKISLFLDACFRYGKPTLILIAAYELPYISSETLLVYLW